jgi:YidC/Oxa1 family membrane protein insertase
MDNLRLVLWIGLALILFVNYEKWQRDFSAPSPAAPTATSAAASGAAVDGRARPPAAAAALSDSLPAVAPAAPAAPPVSAPVGLPAALPTAVPAEGSQVAASAPDVATVHVRTDVLDLDINSQGVEIRRADLLGYPKKKDTPSEPMRLFSTDPADLFLFQWGVTAGGSQPEPNHKAIFSAVAPAYELAAGRDELVVPLKWNNGEGLTATRTLTFHRGSYAIQLSQSVSNGTSTPWRARAYSQLLRHWQPADRSMWDPETYAFKGPAIYDGRKYQKLDAEKPDSDQLPKAPLAGGWAAAMQHHFVAAIVPDPSELMQYTLSVKDKEFLLGVAGLEHEIKPGSSAEFRETLFVGPKLQSQLAAAGPRLELTADYGRLTVVAQPLFWLLAQVHKVVGNWGWSIIIVTFLIKLCFYPLAQTSGRSMARMRSIAPRMKAIQERYKDDREQLGKQMMELYKREKVNPLAGCLPIVVQIPVFMGFYWVLLESVEMRQAPFLLWVQDLSTRDVYFILPALMGAAMFGQFKLNPAPPDPMQAKVFAFMPLVMTVMMAFFPAGLVLYWITNTALSIAQQWRINKLVEAEEKKHRG